MKVDQSFLQWAIDGILGIGMYMFKTHADNVKDRHNKLLEAHEKLQEEQNILREEITKVKVSYVPKEDMRAFREEMNGRFDRLEDLIRK